MPGRSVLTRQGRADRATAFIRAHTTLTAPPLLPELRLHLAAEPISLWQQIEHETGRHEPVPFWAFPWAGGTALARYLLDFPGRVAGRTVLDMAAGSGLVAIAAARAGAPAVLASEIDPLAATAIAVNAAANGVTIQLVPGDLLAADAPAADAPAADLIVVGDACYEKLLAGRLMSFLSRARAAGAQVLIGDPGRAYLPQGAALQAVARYAVPTWPGLEDAPVKETVVWQLR